LLLILLQILRTNLSLLFLHARLFCRSLSSQSCLGCLMLVQRCLTRHGQRSISSVDFGSHLHTSRYIINLWDNLVHCIPHCVYSFSAFLLRSIVLVAEVCSVSLQFITNALVWTHRIDALTVEFVLILEAFGVEVAWEIRLELLNIFIRPNCSRFRFHYCIGPVNPFQIVFWLVTSFIRENVGILALFSYGRALLT